MTPVTVAKDKKKLEDSTLGKTAFWLTIVADIMILLAALSHGNNKHFSILYWVFIVPSTIMAIYDLNNKDTSNKMPRRALFLGLGGLGILLIVAILSVVISYLGYVSSLK